MNLWRLKVATAAIILVLIPMMVIGADVIQNISFDSPKIVQSDGFDKVMVTEGMNIQEAGSPALPSVGYWFVLPPGEHATSVRLTNEKWIRVDRSLKIAPAPALQKLSDTKNIPLTPNPDVYSQDAFFPTQAATDLQTHLKRGVSLASVLVWPIRWNPQTGVLEYLASADINLTSEIGIQESESFNRFYRGDVSTMQWVRSRVENGNDLMGYPHRDDPEAEAMLVICNTDLMEDMEVYVGWRNEFGVRTYLVSVDEVLEAEGGTDDPEKIRNGIITAYEEWGIDYVLFVGDDEAIEHRGLTATVNDEPEPDIPADTYFAGLDGNWNDDNDDFWGETEEEDLLSEVYVGRIAADDVRELNNALTKIYLYSEEPVMDDVEDVLMVGEDLGWVAWGGDHMDEVYEGSENYDFETVGYTDNFNRTNLYDRDEVWNPMNQLAPLISEGPQFLNHLGHANTWYGLKFSINMISDNNITNDGIDNGLTIGYTQGCYDGSFDNRSTEVGQYGDDCFIEKFSVGMRNGFVAFLANSRYGWGSGGNTNGASQHFHREFVDAIFDEDITIIGRTNQDSKEDAAPWINWGAIRWCFYEVNLFGDPLMDIWTSVPEEIEAEYDPVILIGEDSFDISVPGVSGATVCLSRDQEILSVGITDNRGNAELFIPEPITPPGPVTITITAHDFLPFSGEIMSSPSDAGFPWVEELQISDLNGIEDGRIDAGETIELNPLVENLGHGALEGLIVTAMIDDELVNLITGSVAFPMIDGDGESTPEEPLVFEIGSNCDDLHELKITLSFVDAEEVEWTQELSLFTHAPNFSDHIIVVNDENGNNNGRLNPGEEVELAFAIVNTGSGSARDLTLEMTSGNPYIEVIEGEGSIALAEANSASYTETNFRIRVSEECPDPYHAVLYMTMNSEMCGRHDFIVNMKMGGEFFTFEDVEEVWEHEIIGEENLDQWHLCDNDNYTPDGSNCLKVGGDNPNDEYAGMLNCALYTPVLTITSPLQMSFWHKMNAEYSEAHEGYAYDGGFLEISVDDGDWELFYPGIDQEDDYPFMFRRGGSPSPMLQDAPCYSGEFDWQQVVFDFSDYMDSEIQVRFRFGSDGGTNGLGWWIDDIELMMPMDVVSPDNLEGEMTNTGLQLSWDTPQPERDDLGAQNELIGYYIYRDIGIWNRIDTMLCVNHYFDNLLEFQDRTLTYMVTAKYSHGESTPSNFLVVDWVNSAPVAREELPTDWAISAVYPNPFNSHTRISYTVPTLGVVKIAVFDQQGRMVQEIINSELQPGKYNAMFNGEALPSGIYVVRMEDPANIRASKLVLVK